MSALCVRVVVRLGFVRSGVASWYVVCFFFKQKTAYEMRISDWSSDVCSSDLGVHSHGKGVGAGQAQRVGGFGAQPLGLGGGQLRGVERDADGADVGVGEPRYLKVRVERLAKARHRIMRQPAHRSAEHTSEL